MSINNKPFFFSEVVTNEKRPPGDQTRWPSFYVSMDVRLRAINKTPLSKVHSVEPLCWWSVQFDIWWWFDMVVLIKVL
jgi:hypothetical protein